MNITRMIEIAEMLRELYLTRAELSLREWQYEKDAEARRLYITPPPPEGWPGKNAEERKVAAERCFASDEVLKKIGEQATLAHVELVQCEAMIQGLDAERRALEYAVKSEMVNALMQRHIEPRADEYEGPVEMAVDEQVYTYASEEIPF